MGMWIKVDGVAVNVDAAREIQRTAEGVRLTFGGRHDGQQSLAHFVPVKGDDARRILEAMSRQGVNLEPPPPPTPGGIKVV